MHVYLYSCDGITELLLHYSNHQCHMIYPDLLLKKQFLFLSMLKTVVLLNIFVETLIHLSLKCFIVLYSLLFFRKTMFRVERERERERERESLKNL